MAKTKQPTISDLKKELYKCYMRWKDIYEGGCCDPSWEDGTNMNLVRNHILYYHLLLEEKCGSNYFLYPDEYFWPLPPQVPENFMCKERRLACRGVTLPATNPSMPKNWWQFCIAM